MLKLALNLALILTLAVLPSAAEVTTPSLSQKRISVINTFDSIGAVCEGVSRMGPDGMIWLGTENGSIVRLDPSKPHKVAADERVFEFGISRITPIREFMFVSSFDRTSRVMHANSKGTSIPTEDALSREPSESGGRWFFLTERGIPYELNKNLELIELNQHRLTEVGDKSAWFGGDRLKILQSAFIGGADPAFVCFATETKNTDMFRTYRPPSHSLVWIPLDGRPLAKRQVQFPGKRMFEKHDLIYYSFAEVDPELYKQIQEAWRDPKEVRRLIDLGRAKHPQCALDISHEIPNSDHVRMPPIVVKRDGEDFAMFISETGGVFECARNTWRPIIELNSRPVSPLIELGNNEFAVICQKDLESQPILHVFSLNGAVIARGPIKDFAGHELKSAISSEAAIFKGSDQRMNCMVGCTDSVLRIIDAKTGIVVGSIQISGSPKKVTTNHIQKPIQLSLTEFLISPRPYLSPYDYEGTKCEHTIIRIED